MNNLIKLIEGGVCAPKGFLASGVSAGIKKSNKLDLALIYSSNDAIASGVFTTNHIKAAPLLLTEKNLKTNCLRAIITNSGNANACTGIQGELDAAQMASAVANQLGIDNNKIAVASTGVIGVQLPVAKITAAIPNLVDKLDLDGSFAAKAIMTTDTFSKQSAVEIQLSDGTKVRIGGIAKGSGMIHPNMATMLGFITTDVDISSEPLQIALKEATNNSFNMISVDGDTSTNDMVLIMANKQSGNRTISSIDNPDWQIFLQGLETVCIDLAKQIARDGEGATKLISVNVSGIDDTDSAREIARSVIKSNLVKAAIFGNDANWGRIACAVGYAGPKIDLARLTIKLGDLVLLNKGTPVEFSEEKATEILNKEEVIIDVNLGEGKARTTAWGCDLSYDYVRINGSYRT